MVIREGTHSPLRLPKILEDPRQIDCKVRFTHSCKYDIGPKDQMDVNKLFGIGYFSSRFFYLKDFKFFGTKVTLPWFRPMHHVNSVRFGWRYNPSQPEKIEILAYWYDNTERRDKSMGFVDIGKQYTFTMTIRDGVHMLCVDYHYPATRLYFEILLNNHDVGYLLGPYFGGNRRAPHDMVIVMSNH